MNHYIDPLTEEVFAYDDEQVACGAVRDGLVPCEPRPSRYHRWSNGDWMLDRPAMDQEVANEERLKRNALLAQCDWTQSADIAADARMAWQPYRQALRDITLQSGFPYNIVWPQKPV